MCWAGLLIWAEQTLAPGLFYSIAAGEPLGNQRAPNGNKKEKNIKETLWLSFLVYYQIKKIKENF
jgi:hypothetical protein